MIRKVLTAGLLVAGATGFALADRGADDGQRDDRGGNRGSSTTSTSGSSSTSTELRLRTRLTGPRHNGVNPEGNAEFRSNPSRGRSSFKVQAERVNLPAGTVLTVTLTHNGASQIVGNITLDAFGFGELDLDSQDGDTVPAVQQGDTVTVLNGGAGILIGIF